MTADDRPVTVASSMERLDSYVVGLLAFGGLGLFLGVAIIALVPSQDQPAWFFVGWVVAGLSAMAVVAGAVGVAVRFAVGAVIAAVRDTRVDT